MRRTSPSLSSASPAPESSGCERTSAPMRAAPPSRAAATDISLNPRLKPARVVNLPFLARATAFDAIARAAFVLPESQSASESARAAYTYGSSAVFSPAFTSRSRKARASFVSPSASAMSAAIRRTPSPGAPGASTAPSRRNRSSAPFGSPLDMCASAHSQAFSTRATALDGSFDAACAKNAPSGARPARRAAGLRLAPPAACAQA